MDKNAETLARIIKEMTQGMSGSRKAKKIAEKIASGKATYADALDYARENSRVLTKSISNNVGEALEPDGRLFREAANVVIKTPMEESSRQVIDVAAEIQQSMNDAAGIGIQAIKPEINEDQIDGIITGICNAESYEAGQNTFLTQIGNFLEGTVDDVARGNAEFHYQAGLSPKIERRTTGKGCTRCDALVGVYDYEEVRDKGNPVFQRHKNCHCVVDYIPANGSKRQNVHTKQWTTTRDTGSEGRENLRELNLQQFGGRTGQDRAAQYGNQWQGASLWETVEQFAPGSTGRLSENGVKTYFDSLDGTRSVVYDNNGNYFRIMDRTNNTRKRYLGLNGQSVANITENGKQRGTHRDEYERLTHFLNTD